MGTVSTVMEEPHPIPLPLPVRVMKETSSFKCLDATVSLSHQKIHYPVLLRKPIETVLRPGSLIINAASQVTSTLTGPGPPNTCTEVANPDDIHSSKDSKSNPDLSTIDGHTNNPGGQDEENECSLSDELGIKNASATSELQDSTIESSADDYISDPDFQCGVQEVD